MLLISYNKCMLFKELFYFSWVNLCCTQRVLLTCVEKKNNKKAYPLMFFRKEGSALNLMVDKSV